MADLLVSLPFREVWAVDFEFVARDGARPDPVCLVAKELRSGRLLRRWQDDLRLLPGAPFATDATALMVAYFASAELGCFLALGWSLPVRILDLFAEFRVKTNGLPVPRGKGLLGAMAYHGLDSMEAEEKDEMRDLILSGGPWSDPERRAILDYCQADVDALARLLQCMLPTIRGADPVANLGRALLRGRYLAAVARMEWYGVPIDTGSLDQIRVHWEVLKANIIKTVDADYGIFEGSIFSSRRFEQWLIRNGIPWPRLPSGALALDRDTFREMARSYPLVAPIHELRNNLSELRLNKLAVGPDGRNRTLLSPFGALSGRNTPSASRFIFGPSAWIRSLIKPEPGTGIAYVDFSSQEFAIAAALSGDERMGAAYRTGDVYLAFAKQAGLAPPDATKASHKSIRDRCKAVVLGTQYGMGPESLARRLDTPVLEARNLLQAHREAYPQFWDWSQSAVDAAILNGHISTVFGWTLHPDGEANTRSLMNFPMQGNGAEMLRLAACMATEAGLRICAPVHDALLLEAPLDRLEEDVLRLQELMTAAGRVILDGFEVRTEAEIVRYPDRYRDARGIVMWERVVELLAAIEREGGTCAVASLGCAVRDGGAPTAPTRPVY